MPYSWLAKERAFIFRITHIDNVPWILENGLHSLSSKQDPSFVTIGLPDVISRRKSRQVPAGPRGTLPDYVPFYFTPFSLMAYKIKTGHDMKAVRRQDIVVLVASLRRLAKEQHVRFLYTDRHALLEAANFYESLDALHCIDWPLLQSRDFRRDIDDPQKVERYQAEALVYRHLPVSLLEAIACWGAEETKRVRDWAADAGVDVRVSESPRLYF